VLLLTRDASLVVAVKALLDDDDRVSELESPEELPPVGELPVDAVVIDLPRRSRAASVEGVRGRYSGPLVLLLAHGEDPAKARVAYRCSVLTRPFGMSQLWALLVNSTTEAVTEVIPAVQRGPSPVPRSDQSASPSSRSAPTAGSDRPAVPVPERPARVAEQPELAPERQARRSERPSPPGPQRPPAAAQPHERLAAPAARDAASMPMAARTARADTAADVRPGQAARGGGTVAAWSWRLRRFQHAEAPDAELTQPMTALPPTGNGVAPVVERAGRPPETADMQAAAPVGPEIARRHEEVGSPIPGEAARSAPSDPARQEVSPDPPEAVAGRLAERLRADTVALLLDNNRGLLEVAGGVGLTAAERQLQVEYGHDVLLELFRVGVGLIEDTDRVRGLIRGLPGSRSQSLVMVPLVHEGHGFGALIIGRSSPPGQPRAQFTESEIEALMDFAEDVAAPLRSTVLLRRLKGQLNLPDRT
jgi:hypothetical protein